MANIYDGELQMFVASPRDHDMSRLRFLRWMVENGRLGRLVGPSSGPLAGKLVPTDKRAAARRQIVAGD